MEFDTYNAEIDDRNVYATKHELSTILLENPQLFVAMATEPDMRMRDVFKMTIENLRDKAARFILVVAVFYRRLRRCSMSRHQPRIALGVCLVGRRLTIGRKTRRPSSIFTLVIFACKQRQLFSISFFSFSVGCTIVFSVL